MGHYAQVVSRDDDGRPAGSRGPEADGVSSLTVAELIHMGPVSLAETFGLPAERIRRDLVASRAIS